MYNIKFTPAALEDLKEIKRYITDELYDEQSAINTVTKVTKRIRQLSDFPEIGSPLAAIVNIDTPYRFLVCGNYIAFYKIVLDEVQIIRILYGRRNYLKVLFGELDTLN